jgi:hypothetical protein
MEISDRIRISMAIHGFWQTVNIRRMYGINHIYARYGPYLQVVQGLIPSNSSLFCSFWSIFFLAPLLTELFLCFPFQMMHVLCINN